jgi:isopenicillin-N epimerase
MALVTNVTEALSTVLAALDVRAGDEVVLSDHGYGAVRLAVDAWCTRAGVVLREARVPLDANDETVVAAYQEQLSERTRLVVVDQITSPTARIMPVSAVVAAARPTGAMVVVDAAHGPGHLAVDIEGLGADAWVGNLHKWAFAARGTATLWITPRWRDRVRPLVLGWAANDDFPGRFDARGTSDLSAWMAVPEALQLWEALGGWTMAARNSDLAAWGQHHVAEALDVGLEGMPTTPAPAMRLIPLPDGVGSTEAAVRAAELCRYRGRRHRVGRQNLAARRDPGLHHRTRPRPPGRDPPDLPVAVRPKQPISRDCPVNGVSGPTRQPIGLAGRVADDRDTAGREPDETG